MSGDWDDLTPAAKTQAEKPPVRIGIASLGKHGRLRLVLYLRRAVLADLGGKAARYRVSLGKGGETRTLLRIAQDDQGPFEANELGTAKGGGTYRIFAPLPERMPRCAIDAIGCAFERDKRSGALLVTLPSWAWDAGQKSAAERRAGEARKAEAAADGLGAGDAIAKHLEASVRARLCAMAKEAGKPVSQFAAGLLAGVVLDDAEAEGEGE